MNTTTNAAPANVDVSGQTVVVTLDDLFPIYGEGDTRDEAMHDLVESVGEILTDLRESRDRLSPELAAQLRFLERLEWEFRNRDDGSVTFP